MESASMADVETSNKLIQLVKDQPSLYDKDLEDFKDEYKKSETWRVIAETLNLDVDETQKQWARLRVEFGRHRRRRKAAEAAGGFIRDWPLYSQLGWLAPHVKTRAKRGKSQNDRTYTYAPRTILPRRSDWLMGTNTERGVSVEVSPSIVMQNGHSDMTESFVVSPDAADYDEEGSLDNGLHGSIKREMDLGKDHEDMHAADSRSCQPTGYEEEDEDNLFCRSICASLKRFSHQQKALAKIRIQQVMYDVEFDELTASDVNAFLKRYGLEHSLFLEEMRAALGPGTKDGIFLYSLDANVFSWKRQLSPGLIKKLGQIKVKEVSVNETYEGIVDKLLTDLFSTQKEVVRLKDENSSLSKGQNLALEKVKEFAALKEEWEMKLYGQFVAVLNSKKERIQALEEELDLKLNCDNEDAMDEGGPGPVRSEQTKDEDTDEDPYGGDTDEDVDGDSDTSRFPTSASTSVASTALRRNRDIFNSESPGSPSPVFLPKRTRGLPRGSTSASTSTSASSGPSAATARNVFKGVVDEEDDDDDDMEPLTLGENTQDILDQI